jgi:excisionase family DNA binding protein
MSTIEQQSPMMTISEVAGVLHVHPVTVRRMIARGDLPSVRLGTGVRARVRVDPEDLRAFTTPMKARWSARDWRSTHPEAAARSSAPKP